MQGRFTCCATINTLNPHCVLKFTTSELVLGVYYIPRLLDTVAMVPPSQPTGPGADAEIDASAGSASPGPAHLRPSRSLSLPTDGDWLSPHLCQLRALLEVFPAVPADIQARIRIGGSRNPPRPGQVGIRCIYCSSLPLERRVRGSESFPSCLKNVHQSIRNFQRHHYDACRLIPPAARAVIDGLRSQGVSQSRPGSVAYWPRSCAEQLHMVDGADGGIYFAAGQLPGPAAENVAAAPGVAGAETCAGMVGPGMPPWPAGGGASVTLEGPAYPITPLTLSAPSYPPVLSSLAISSPASEEPYSVAPAPAAGRRDALIGLVRTSLGIAEKMHRLHHAGVAAAPERGLGRPSGSERGDPIERLAGAVNRASVRLDVVNRAAGLAEVIGRTSKCVPAAAGGFLAGARIRDDLGLFGRALYGFLTNGELSPDETDVESQYDRDRSTKRRRSSADRFRLLDELHSHGVPSLLATLVGNLLDAGNLASPSRYHDAEELEEDLRLMCGDPSRYLFDLPGGGGGDPATGFLAGGVPGRLYGREDQIAVLLQALKRAAGTNPDGAGRRCQVVFVRGYSGAGKSVLVDQLRGPVADCFGHFVSGKFDLRGQVQPMQVVFQAFDGYCKSVLEGDADVLEQTRADVGASLGSHANVLTGVIPNLSHLVQDYSAPNFSSTGSDAVQRLLHHFRALVRTIASPHHPIVFFLDDLQWSDRSTLEMLCFILTDMTIRSILFIGSYRENGVGPAHPLHSFRSGIEAAGIVCRDVKLANLTRESVNDLVCDSFRLLPRLTFSLSDIVHSKTGGNPLFLVQFLRSLHDEKLVQYSTESRCWKWDTEAIASKDVPDDVVGLMLGKMRKLDADVQWILKVAACFGSGCDSDLLYLLGKDPDALSVSLKLDVATREGLLSRTSKSENQYKFGHDQIASAAYTLIPPEERAEMHLTIGRQLFARIPEAKLDNYIFIVADQMSRGSSNLCDHAECIQVAGLCLRACEKAASLSAYQTALTHALQASDLLQENDWETNYELTLKIYVKIADAQQVTGNSEAAIATLSNIFSKCRSFDDKVDAYAILLNSLGAQGELKQAMEESVRVLKILGEEVPEKPSLINIMPDVWSTRLLLEKSNHMDIVSKKEMSDRQKLASMKMLYKIMYHAYQADQQLFMMFALRMIQHSLVYGPTKESSAAFAGFSIFNHSVGRHDDARALSKAAVALMERFQDENVSTATTIALYSSVYSFYEPLDACATKCRDGYEMGMASGEISWGLAGGHMEILISSQCGTPLARVYETGQRYVQEMKDRNDFYLERLTVPVLQFMLNLLGESPDDPTLLSGSAMDQEDIMQRSSERNLINVKSLICVLRLRLAFIFGKYEIAAELAEWRLDVSKTRPLRGATYVNELWFTGLTAVAMFKKKKDPSKWRKVATQALKKLFQWTEMSQWNFQHKYELLRAEILCYIHDDPNAALSSYENAIKLAGQHRFVNDQAVAYECAGGFFAATCAPKAAADYFMKAQQSYSEWGATSKVQQLIHKRTNTD